MFPFINKKKKNIGFLYTLAPESSFEVTKSENKAKI